LRVERVDRHTAQGQILPDLSLVPGQNGVELQQALVALLQLEVVRPRAPFGAPQTRDPTGHAHVLDRPAHGLHLEQVATAVRIGGVEAVWHLHVVLEDARLRISCHGLGHELLGGSGLVASRHDEGPDRRTDALGQVPNSDRVLPQTVRYDEAIAVLAIGISQEIKRALDLLGKVELVDQVVDLLRRRGDVHAHSSLLAAPASRRPFTRPRQCNVIFLMRQIGIAYELPTAHAWPY
jgi:hypothetical protein